MNMVVNFRKWESSEITHTVPSKCSNLLELPSEVFTNHSISTYFHVPQRTDIPVSQNPDITSTHQPFPIWTERHTNPVLCVAVTSVQKLACAGIPYSEQATKIYRGDMSSVRAECNRECGLGTVQQSFRRAIAKRPNANTGPFSSDKEMAIGRKTERLDRIQTLQRKSVSFSCYFP